jgi:hypothetical protein
MMPRRKEVDDEVNDQTRNWMVAEIGTNSTLATATKAPAKTKRGELDEDAQIQSFSAARRAITREQEENPSQSTILTTNSSLITKDDPVEDVISPNQKLPFPWKLHTLLDDAEREGYQDIVSWEADGAAFRVHKPFEFCEFFLGRYFRQSKYESFTRQCERLPRYFGSRF